MLIIEQVIQVLEISMEKQQIVLHKIDLIGTPDLAHFYIKVFHRLSLPLGAYASHWLGVSFSFRHQRGAHRADDWELPKRLCLATLPPHSRAGTGAACCRFSWWVVGWRAGILLKPTWRMDNALLQWSAGAACLPRFSVARGAMSRAICRCNADLQ